MRCLLAWMQISLECFPLTCCRLGHSFWQCVVKQPTLVLLATKWLWEFSVASYLFWYSQVRFLVSEWLILLFMVYGFIVRLASVLENRHLAFILLRASEVTLKWKKWRRNNVFLTCLCYRLEERGRVSNLRTQLLDWGPDSVIYSMFQSRVVSPEHHQRTPSAGPQGFWRRLGY